VAGRERATLDEVLEDRPRLQAVPFEEVLVIAGEALSAARGPSEADR
jgi:hypothetical protein